MPTTKAAQHTGPFTTDGSRPADLKDHNAGLYGSQPPPTARARGARPGEPLRKVLGGDGAAVGAGSRQGSSSSRGCCFPARTCC
ncbi:unnamed protein product [Urochloa humidicola]